MKLTQWFSGDVKPVRVGVYMTSGKVFQYWNGQFWGMASCARWKAFEYRHEKSLFQSGKWRGIIKDEK